MRPALNARPFRWVSAKRSGAVEAELEVLHTKYQTLHDATQTKMKNIMEEWRKDREWMEEKVKSCEERRQKAFEEVTEAMRGVQEAMEVKSRSLQDSCLELVLQQQRRSAGRAEALSEAARGAAEEEERRALETQQEAMRWKKQIEGIEKKADEQIEVYQMRAATMEAQLEKDAKAQVSLSKRLAQTAAEEEKARPACRWLPAE